MRDKQVQIPMTLFLALVRYFWVGDCDAKTVETIREGLKTKVDQMAERERYGRRFGNKDSGVTPL